MSNIVLKTHASNGNLPEADRRAISEYLHTQSGNGLIVSIVPDRDIPGTLSILSMEVLAQSVEQMEELLNTAVNHEDSQGVRALLCDLSQWENYTGAMQASALYYRDIARATAIERMPDSIKGQTPAIRRDWIATSTASQNMMYERCERLNSSFGKRLITLSSLLSYSKAELSAFSGGEAAKK